MNSPLTVTIGKLAGVVGAIWGSLMSLVLLFVPLGTEMIESPAGEEIIESGPIGIEYLFHLLGADGINVEIVAPLFFSAVVVLGTSLAGGYSVLTETRRLLYIATLVFMGLTVLALASFGLLIAPAAIAFGIASVLFYKRPSS